MLKDKPNMYSGAFSHLFNLQLNPNPDLNDYHWVKTEIIKIMEESFPNSSHSEEDLGDQKQYNFSIGIFENLVVDCCLNFDPNDGLSIDYQIFDSQISETLYLSKTKL
jgi:hypothetical protein